MENRFAERLLTIRQDKGINQRDLAKSINMTQAAISRWEKGIQTPDIESLYRLCKFFDISADYLIGLTDND